MILWYAAGAISSTTAKATRKRLVACMIIDAVGSCSKDCVRTIAGNRTMPEPRAERHAPQSASARFWREEVCSTGPGIDPSSLRVLDGQHGAFAPGENRTTSR